MHVDANLTSKYQTTVPAAIRAVLGVKPGDRLRFEVDDDGSIRVSKDVSSLADLSGIVSSEVELTDDELAAAIEEARLVIGGGHDRD